ncbi:MAG: methionyl-tRNA formyltransferase [Rhodospirillaceae bacterium]|nr:methionyl-tRNA formyltransferase [Rhodospirillaceae bacterium]MBT4046573.1 methionyl-tRNA formyltransferase [Rhodospirillaceae bacterium]MBT4690865.1 methionyl-tRNA formyltransferase [Rhodospirillaceae bacterium]MBT5081554.1 methionyl-tRNA formyltransferase [Rhodospirillaceae bacterium]MBT5526996.1 methionyl-tRNA formyltransferase [Rhodospirillaceae bacterium]
MSGDIIFLAANTPRSQAYAQAMAAKDIRLAQVILFDRPGAGQSGKASELVRPQMATTIPLPDPNIPLLETLAGLADRIDHIEAEKITDPAILTAVKEAIADGTGLAVYSGYGGQLVSPELLSLGIPFLHAHSGWLPEYRGSTTVYYSLLAEGNCGVSVIQLVPAIDQGPIVARRRYPAPPVDVDIDYFYDSAMRADLMVDVVANWQADDVLPQVSAHGETGEDEGADYYVIHPLLKHLALLSLEEDQAD